MQEYITATKTAAIEIKNINNKVALVNIKNIYSEKYGERIYCSLTFHDDYENNNKKCTNNQFLILTI